MEEDGGGSFSFGEESAAECARIVAKGAATRTFAFSPHTRFCWGCTEQQLGSRVPNQQYNIYLASAFRTGPIHREVGAGAAPAAAPAAGVAATIPPPAHGAVGAVSATEAGVAQPTTPQPAAQQHGDPPTPQPPARPGRGGAQPQRAQHSPPPAPPPSPAPPKLNHQLLAYSGYVCGSSSAGGRAHDSAQPTGNGLDWGRSSPLECATAVAAAEHVLPYFAWSEATSMCWSCSGEQLRKRTRNALYNIYNVDAFVHVPASTPSSLTSPAATQPTSRLRRARGHSR